MLTINMNFAALTGLFERYHFTTSCSPMLDSVDVGGSDGETFYINWHDAEGDEYSVEIPFQNVAEARIENDKLVVRDKSGEEECIAFYDVQQVRHDSPQKITHTHEYGKSVWVVRLPKQYILPEGEYFDLGDDELPVNLQAICQLLALSFEPNKGESLQIEDFVPSVIELSEEQIDEAIKTEEGFEHG